MFPKGNMGEGVSESELFRHIHTVEQYGVQVEIPTHSLTLTHSLTHSLTHRGRMVRG